MQRSVKPVSVKRILLLFFTTMALSLVILIVLFNLFFKNIDIEFDTRLPEQAPLVELEEAPTVDGVTTEDDDLSSGRILPKTEAAFQRDNITRAVVSVPGEFQPGPATELSKKKVGPSLIVVQV